MSIDPGHVSSIIGYDIKVGDTPPGSFNLPQSIAILGEANTLNQTGLPTEKTDISSALIAAKIFGFGSPIHRIASILFPNSGLGIGSIPCSVYAQEEESGFVAKVMEITPTGTATKNGTHTLIIGGRRGIDGVFYNINILKNDTVALLTVKIKDAINAVAGSPVIATSTDTTVTLTTKWKGLTSQDLNVSIDTNNLDLGFTYAVSETTAGSGTPSIQAALDSFDNNWHTIVINSYGAIDDILDVIETFNGKPDINDPTGRYSSSIFKPGLYFTGSVLDDPSNLTVLRRNEVSICLAPAPLSTGFPMEAAANMAYLFAITAQKTPYLDVLNQNYPDMPTPNNIGTMASSTNRDLYVKKGCSTVLLVDGKYKVIDLVTTYRPEGELPPAYRYCRDLNIHFNIRFKYLLLERIYVISKTIVKDDDIVTVRGIIKPKIWKAQLSSLADDLVASAFIVDAKFMKDSIVVSVSSVNPNRINTVFSYKIPGIGRISSTIAFVRFHFGL